MAPSGGLRPSEVQAGRTVLMPAMPVDLAARLRAAAACHIVLVEVRPVCPTSSRLEAALQPYRPSPRLPAPLEAQIGLFSCPVHLLTVEAVRQPAWRPFKLLVGQRKRRQVLERGRKAKGRRSRQAVRLLAYLGLEF